MNSYVYYTNFNYTNYLSGDSFEVYTLFYFSYKYKVTSDQMYSMQLGIIDTKLTLKTPLYIVLSTPD